MDIGVLVAAVTAVAGLILGVAKVTQDFAPMRRLERLLAARANLPKSSIARKAIDEAIDWISLGLLVKERDPINMPTQIFGFFSYLMGVSVAMASFSLMFVTRTGILAKFSTADLITLGVLGVVVMLIGLLLVFGPIDTFLRKRKLFKLHKLETAEIIKAHKRHDLYGSSG